MKTKRCIYTEISEWKTERKELKKIYKLNYKNSQQWNENYKYVVLTGKYGIKERKTEKKKMQKNYLK